MGPLPMFDTWSRVRYLELNVQRDDVCHLCIISLSLRHAVWKTPVDIPGGGGVPLTQYHA